MVGKTMAGFERGCIMDGRLLLFGRGGFPIAVSMLLCFASSVFGASVFPEPRQIRPPGAYPVLEREYFTDYHGNTLDFEDVEDLERVATFGPGIRDVEVAGGTLRFVAGKKNAWFYFGRWDYPKGDLGICDENIGAGWRVQYERIELRMRVKQSGGACKWTVGTRVAHGSPGNVPGHSWNDTVTVKATNWHEIRMELPFYRGWPIRALRVSIVPIPSLSVDLKPGVGEQEPEMEDLIPDELLGDEIAIDYIRIVNLTTPVFFRKSVHLDGKPVYGALRVNPRTEHSVHVNGRQVHYYHGFLNNICDNPVIDITPFLKQGDNVIAVGLTNTYWLGGDGRHGLRRSPYCQLECEGLALSEKGSFTSINSDGGWLATFEESSGWMGADFDDSGWSNAVVCKQDEYLRLKPGQTGYVGPLMPRIDGDPIFKLRNGMNLPIVLPLGYSVAFTITNSFTGDEVAHGRFAEGTESGHIRTHRLLYRPEHAGVYDVTLRLLNGKGAEVAQRSLETAVVGPIAQKKVKGTSFTEGMELTLLEDIDCTESPPAVTGKKKTLPSALSGGAPKEESVTGYSLDPDADSSDAEPVTDTAVDATRRKSWTGYRLFGGNTKVVDSPIGKYRITGPKVWNRFGYMFSVSNMYKPHLIEVEFPDDSERLIMAKVMCIGDSNALEAPEKYDWGAAWSFDQRWYSGVATGGERFPPSNTFKKLYLVFWPDRHRDLNAILIINEKQGVPAAAGRIRIYEIDDLPALDLPETPGRLYGMFCEREYLAPKTFYSGRYYPGFRHRERCNEDRPGRLRDWYDTCSNMIKYLRFSGQNLYVPGYYMYTGTFFPESEGRSRSNRMRANTDRFKLMAAMFEENGIDLLLGTQYFTSWPSMERAMPANGEVLLKSKPTVLGVGIDGTQSLLSGSAASGAMDYTCATVCRDLEELMQLYLYHAGSHNSVKGVFFHTASVGFPSIPMIQKMGGKLDSALAWQLDDRSVVDFENATGETFPEFVQTDQTRFSRRYDYLLAHPDLLEKWIDFRCRRVHDVVTDLADLVCSERPDWKLFVNPVTPALHEATLCERGKMTYIEAIRRRGHDPALYDESYVVNALNVVLRHARQTGEKFGDIWNPKDSLYYAARWPAPAHSQTVTPVEPYGAYDYIDCLAKTAPSVLIFGKADIRLITGGEQAMRPFVRAYRSLPVGRYVTRRGDGFDNAMAVRECKTENVHCFYIANPSSRSIIARAAFDGSVTLVDLSENETCGEGNEIDVTVGPYGLRVFGVEPVSAGLRSILKK